MKEKSNEIMSDINKAITSESCPNIFISNDNNFSSADHYHKNNFMSPPIGGSIKCLTCFGNVVQGKVVAYDQQTKILALSNF